MNYGLSKSKYCSGVQCPKMLWLYKHMPEAFDESVLNQAVLNTGSQVGDVAMGLFGDYKEVPFNGNNLGKMVADTENLIEAGVPVIAEASFSLNGLFCSVDILKNLGNKTVELYEVKSSTEVKSIYYDDVSFQYYVLIELGYNVKSCSLVYINSKYILEDELDLHELFTIVDVTHDIEAMRDKVAHNLNVFKEYMTKEEEPCDDIGMQCFEPYKCGFFNHCTQCLPHPNVFDVSGMQNRTKIKYYQNNIISFNDITTKGSLPYEKQIQVDHELQKRPLQIDKEKIKEHMKKYTYPLYFLDFESYQPAIPEYQGTSPYKQIVFQYSLHYIEREGGELKHTAFLANPGKDPRRALAEQLCADIPLNVCTVVYNKSFEQGRINELAEIYPDLSEHLLNIHDNIVDLAEPFGKKWYYCRDFKGKSSIKIVLPTLYPDDDILDYHNLEGVHNGSEASDTFKKMAEMDDDELQQKREELLSYCHLDTLAMVKIWEKLKDI